MKQSDPSKPVQRFDTIDLLRGLSVLSVVYLHITIALPEYLQRETYPVWLQTQYGILGGAGVACFFAISGFLITLTSISRFGSLAEVVPSTFYRVRFARIAPPLLLLLCILSALHVARVAPFYIDHSVSTLQRALFAVLTFQFNILAATHHWFPASWVPLWSLSVEEMFYLCFPLLCTILLRKRWGLPLFFSVLIAFVVLGPITRVSGYATHRARDLHSYPENMDNIALGCLFGILANHIGSRFSALKPVWLYPMQTLGVALMLIAVSPACPSIRPIIQFQMLMWSSWTQQDVLGLGTCLVMLGCVLNPSHGSRFTLPVRWIGRYSYEVYLNHEFIVIGVLLLYGKVQKGPVSLWAVAIILMSGLLGYLISRYVSEPMNRILRGSTLPSQLNSTQSA